jgi:large subunit ribosomal protein L25
MNDGKKLEALIREVDTDPVKGELRHADFYILEKGKKVQIDIPLEFVGEAPCVKLGGIVVKVLHEMKVEADPKNLPHVIEVDISSLTTLESHIAVKDLKLGAGVVAIEGADEVVASVTVAKEEVEAAPVDLSAIEVEKKGKKEEAATAEGEEA